MTLDMCPLSIFCSRGTPPREVLNNKETMPKVDKETEPKVGFWHETVIFSRCFIVFGSLPLSPVLHGLV